MVVADANAVAGQGACSSRGTEPRTTEQRTKELLNCKYIVVIVQRQSIVVVVVEVVLLVKQQAILLHKNISYI